MVLLGQMGFSVIFGLFSGTQSTMMIEIHAVANSLYSGGAGPQCVPWSGRWADPARGGVAGGAYRGRARSGLSNHGCGGGVVLRRLAHEGNIPDAARLIERLAVFCTQSGEVAMTGSVHRDHPRGHPSKRNISPTPPATLHAREANAAPGTGA